MKFKVGDKVKILPSINDSKFSFCLGMDAYIGQEATIVRGLDDGHVYLNKDGKEIGCYQIEQLSLIENNMPTRTFTNSQKIRLRLKTFWDKHDTGYDDFEEFYTDFTNAVLNNLEFLAETFKLEK